MAGDVRRCALGGPTWARGACPWRFVSVSRPTIRRVSEAAEAAPASSARLLTCTRSSPLSGAGYHRRSAAP